MFDRIIKAISGSLITAIFWYSGGTIGYSQYINSVTHPDKSRPRITDESDLSVRYAAGISPFTLREHLKVLASDSLEGRETGQKGMELAADYLSKHIRNLGLLPGGNDGSYYQPVAFTASKWNSTNIFINKTKYRLLWDFIALPENNISMDSFTVSEVIFMGYGIDDPKYSDYKKADVKGRVIMINHGEPVDKKGNSVITGNESLSAWSTDLENKLKVAKNKGAKLVLVIEEDIKKKLEENRRKLLGGNLELGDRTKMVFDQANHIFISSTMARDIIGANEKKIIKAREKISKGKPSSVPLPTSATINLSKDMKVINGKNVIGYIKGKTKPDEYVIISAHYDHLGKRGDEIFNGADDNGSGTSTLLEIAQACQQAVLEANEPARSIVFLWFCGEEKGLLGSSYYSENPIFPLANTVADINVDMVGRIDDKYKDDPDYIYIIGSDRLSTDLHKISEEANQKYTQIKLDYKYNDEKDPNMFYYRSDHYNFAKKGIPVIFYFNGTHADYHRTTDDVDKINFEKMAKVGKLIFHTLWDLSNRTERIAVDGVVK